MSRFISKADVGRLNRELARRSTLPDIHTAPAISKGSGGGAPRAAPEGSGPAAAAGEAAPAAGQHAASVPGGREPADDASGGLLGRKDGGDDERTRLLSSAAGRRPSRDSAVSSGATSDVAGPAARSARLDTFSGVFIPVLLSIWGVLVFLRFGFVVGQAGITGTLLLLSIGYVITTTTTFSISAISTNGTVRSGGPYYMISRSLGPEFGGSIGLVYYIGTVMNAAMNVLGFVEPFIACFGKHNGTLFPIVPEGKWLNFVYGSAVLLTCTGVCLAGSNLFARTSKILALVLAMSTLSMFVSFALRQPFSNEELGVHYSRPNAPTLRSNLWPRFASGGVGSAPGFSSVFGVLFPACTGILAGASMSGDLANPSRSIPKGTLAGVAVTYAGYSAVTLLLGSTVARVTFYSDMNVLQDIAMFPPLITAGVLSTSVFAALSCVIGAAKILQAIAKDNLVPVLTPLGKGTRENDEPVVAVLATYTLAQVLLLAGDINSIAPFVSMCSLLTFGVINLACFLLKAGGAPNFRPTFRYFRASGALIGAATCFAAMFVVDAIAAFLASVVAASIFGVIHYISPPKSWGDVTQSLIYHQVRKYLLRLDTRKEHVKFWRPQILLLVNNPRNATGLILFCNDLKKGALYILGHVIKGDFARQVAECKRQQDLWLRYVDVMQIKAFVSLTIAETERLGARCLILTSGLGGMKPNIVVLSSFDLVDHYRRKSFLDRRNSYPDAPPEDANAGLHLRINMIESLPTDGIKAESPIDILDYMGIIEDALALNKAVAIGHGFENFSPYLHANKTGAGSAGGRAERQKRYIDLWPIQMTLQDGSTNFNMYTMVLQMGCVLQMVKQWKQGYDLRVNVFVERESEAAGEKARVHALLDVLRIRADLTVLWLEGEVDLAAEIAEVARKPRDAHRDVCRPGTPRPRGSGRGTFSAAGSPPPGVGDVAATGRPDAGTPLTFPGSARTAAGSASENRGPQPRRPARTYAAAGPGPPTDFSMIRSKVPLPDSRAMLRDMEDDSDYGDGGLGGETERAAGCEVPPEDANGADAADDGAPWRAGPRGARARALLRGGRQPAARPAASAADGGGGGAVDFNTLPSDAQHRIINKLIRRHSTSESGTAIVFTSLPAPDPGASRDVAKAEKWLRDLHALVGGLEHDGVPVLAIHGVHMTVTSNL